MLANSHICGVQSQNFKLMQNQQFQILLDGGNEPYLLSLDEVFQKNKILKHEYERETKRVFTGIDDKYAAILGVCYSGMFFNEDFDLFTSSISMIYALQKHDEIVGNIPELKCIVDSRYIPAYHIEQVDNNRYRVSEYSFDLDNCTIYPFDCVINSAYNIKHFLQNGNLQVTLGEKKLMIKEDTNRTTTGDFNWVIAKHCFAEEVSTGKPIDLQLDKITGLRRIPNE